MTTRDQLISNLETVRINKDSTYNKLTLKQRSFVAGYIQTYNATQAVCDSYDVKNRGSARVIAHKLRNTPRVQQALLEIYEEAGITIAKIAQVTKKGLNAKKSYSHNGRMVESDCADHAIQLDSAKFALEVMTPSLN
jgi:hypothetical protein